MDKKRRFGKMTVLLLFMFLIICVFGFNYIIMNNVTKSKLVNLGYSDDEVNLIINNVLSKDYDLLINNNNFIIDLINSKEYVKDNFSKYLDYYSKNKKSKIENIISIVNSGYDLLDYPASDLLAALVKEKYYINKNAARYLDYGNTYRVSTKKIVSIVNAKADLDYYTDVSVSNIDDGNLILVNKFYRLPDGYEPDDLVSLSSKYSQGVNDKMRKEAADAFMKMVDAALLDNIILKNASAYRSFDYQVSLYDGYTKRDGVEKADIYSARPGYSEHQTGLCTDINTIDASFHGTSESDWLLENAYKYGFIIRFPKNKEKITGYKYEPWHYRYVGEKAAKIMYKNGLTLEEYYAYYIENKRL